MDSPSQSQLPTIKFKLKNLKNGSTDSFNSTSDSVRAALETYGCFVIEYEEMSPQLYEAMYGLSEELFRLPIETKRNHTSQLPGFGYGGNYAAMPLFEYFGIEHAQTDLESMRKFTGLFWPDGNHYFWYVTFPNAKYTRVIYCDTFQFHYRYLTNLYIV